MRYQMRCPKCGYEFPYDSGDIDKEIEELRAKANSIQTQLSEFKKLTFSEQVQRMAWRKQACFRMNEINQRISKLKGYRKLSNQHATNNLYEAFKNNVRYRFGEEIFRQILEESEKDAEAYKIHELMNMGYSKANYKTGVTSINKVR